jgi:hypothetical protein
VDPHAFEILDELLSTNSEPLMLIESIYWQWLRDFRTHHHLEPFVRTRMMEIHEELLTQGLGALEVNYYRDVPDDVFAAEVLVRFGINDE